MRIVRIAGKKYQWDVERMHPVAFWVMMGGMFIMGAVFIWCMMALPIALWG